MLDSCVALGIKAVEVTGGGEPTLHPAFPEICQEINKRHLDCAVVTNGSRLSYGGSCALAEAKWVRFSLDAATPETYSSIRHVRPDLLGQTRGNIRALAGMRTGPEPIIGVGFVVIRENWHEVVQAANQAKQDRADNFRISAVFQSDGAAYFMDIYEQARQACAAAQSLSNNSFTVFNLFEERIDDLSRQSPGSPLCSIQNLVTYLGADQNLYRCCVLAYNPRGLLGSVKDRTLKDLWNSEEVAVKLHDFDARGCPRCMFNTKNQAIAYIVSDNPPHVNFL